MGMKESRRRRPRERSEGGRMAVGGWRLAVGRRMAVGGRHGRGRAVGGRRRAAPTSTCRSGAQKGNAWIRAVQVHEAAVSEAPGMLPVPCREYMRSVRTCAHTAEAYCAGAQTGARHRRALLDCRAPLDASPPSPFLWRAACPDAMIVRRCGLSMHRRPSTPTRPGHGAGSKVPATCVRAARAVRGKYPGIIDPSCLVPAQYSTVRPRVPMFSVPTRER